MCRYAYDVKLNNDMGLNNSCILGININGVSIKVDTLGFESDQSCYDFICNVDLMNNVNGNGEYAISIVNGEYVAGCPVGGWRLVSGKIVFDWGRSSARFIMADKDKHETGYIVSAYSKGTASGFDIEILARSIFAKARQIVTEYPSALIYNAYDRFQGLKPSKRVLGGCKEKSDANECIRSFSDALDELSGYVESFKALRTLLRECDDPRAETLLVKATDECKEYITSLLGNGN